MPEPLSPVLNGKSLGDPGATQLDGSTEDAAPLDGPGALKRRQSRRLELARPSNARQSSVLRLSSNEARDVVSPGAATEAALAGPGAEQDLSESEARLLRCVALALSTSDGPPVDMLASCEVALAEEPAVVDQLTQILTRLRTHASASGPGAARARQPGASRTGQGHRLPPKGFETLVVLCNAVLKVRRTPPHCFNNTPAPSSFKKSNAPISQRPNATTPQCHNATTLPRYHALAH